MNRTATSKRTRALAASSLAAGLLTGCATHPAPRADLSASRAEPALVLSRHERGFPSASSS